MCERLFEVAKGESRVAVVVEQKFCKITVERKRDVGGVRVKWTIARDKEEECKEPEAEWSAESFRFVVPECQWAVHICVEIDKRLRQSDVQVRVSERGDVYLKRIKGNVKCNVNRGNVFVEAMNSGTLWLNVSVGNTSVDQCYLNSCYMNANAGTESLTNTKICGSCRCNVDVGNNIVQDCVLKDARFTLNAGDVVMKSCKIVGEVRVEIQTTGEVTQTDTELGEEGKLMVKHKKSTRWAEIPVSGNATRSKKDDKRLREALEE